jgi:hypothetical protein
VDDSVISEGFLLRIDDAESDRAIVLEDDGRVAYAYLIIEGQMVGDVWLYNVSPAPDVVDWKDASKIAVGAEVRIGGILMARLEIGSKPGWSRLALCAGPLARPLEHHR